LGGCAGDTWCRGWGGLVETRGEGGGGAKGKGRAVKTDERVTEIGEYPRGERLGRHKAIRLVSRPTNPITTYLNLHMRVFSVCIVEVAATPKSTCAGIMEREGAATTRKGATVVCAPCTTGAAVASVHGHHLALSTARRAGKGRVGWGP